MNQQPVTTYSGFSKVSGNITLAEFFNLISGSTYEHLIQKIGWLVQAGKTKEAGNVKRQLPFFTITAHYQKNRLPESIAGYNDLITIDIDGLTDEQVATLRPIIEQDAATIGSFLTAKQHGYKIIAHLVSASVEKLRKKILSAETITYEQLEEYHEKVYELTRRHYEDILQVEVDTSGKDISRGVFASYDPLAFFSPERLAGVRPLTAKIIAPESAPKRKRKTTSEKVAPTTDTITATGQSTTDISPITQLEFNKCVASVRRTIRYEEGTHNPFLFALGNKCFKRGLDEAEVKLLAAHRFGDNGKWDTDTPISNGYTYISKTEKAELEKENRKPVIEEVKTFLGERYRFRRNTLLERLEFKEISPDAPVKEYRTMAIKDLNTIFLRLSESGISYTFGNLKTIIDSDYATPFDPFLDYFNALLPWDGITDHIALLADTVQTTDRSYWHKVFRRWLVGMVRCAMGTQDINQQVLLLYGQQGKGKSSWIRNLLPPQLREYYCNGMIDPAKNDNMLRLSNRILIDMEEFEGAKPADIAELKRITSQSSVVLRKPYDIQERTYPRRASFIGSTNNTRFLSDISGSRRFMVVQATEINYRTKINYEGLYAQVMYLIENGFQHWFEGEEINIINQRNEQHRMKDPLEENLYVYYRPATPTDYMVKWKPAAAILSYLGGAGRTQVNAQSQQLLIQVLERDGFMKRVNEHGITEYGVIVLTMDEVENNAKRIE
ncbi:VapE domain-containing protein [Bacteroides sp. 51]|uniref:VapE domain-containing protein n=1 Tax=Bacteroides sp. 51 TaxID=2302938 RepID=UPI0013D3ADA2|nr:VapE domain-containing protein [Bacteroides sp. 51]NDV83254.1 virulence protein E [Bacteroides sp. 51]